ncbi:methyltransferase domain-containing protein [Fluviibacterium sp. DFM31]|uniref:Methyltransferase domain-containing protein n=1 Tax=Meridianimarinicoccus marinus TaxID=3231483 RepID=A0ABV3L9J6_9RHOB
MTDPTQKELEAGRGYEALFVPALFAPWTHHVIAGAGITDTSHVLDVACGTGVLTRDVYALCGTSGRVVGLDPAPGMLATAREIAPQIEWVAGQAEDLPFAQAEFDSVISQFGMMFFRDLAAAAQEMHRVTKPGGTLSVAVWDSVEKNPAYAEVVRILKETISSEAADAVRLPFCMGDPVSVTNPLSEAGYDQVSVATRTETARFQNPRTIVEGELRGWLPLFGIHLDEQTIEAVLDISDSRLFKYRRASGQAEFPATAHIVTARKPQ